MKIGLSYLERGYFANLLRIRAERLRERASDKSASAIRSELEEEAAYCEARAQRLDDCEELTADREPIRASERLDIDAIDKPS